MEQFAERANQTFAGLLGGNLEDTLKLPNQWINATTETDGKQKSNLNADEKDSLHFKKPKISGLKRKSLPDHLLNPEKWTRYDLSDVKLSSNTTNTQSALNFLNDLKRLRSLGDASSSKESKDDGCIKFCKPVDDHDKTDACASNSTTAVTAPFAIVMPEYTIGSKKKKDIKKRCSGNGNSATHKMLKLSHLEDSED